MESVTEPELLELLAIKLPGTVRHTIQFLDGMNSMKKNITLVAISTKLVSIVVRENASNAKRDLKSLAEAAEKQRKNIILVAISMRLASIVVRENASNAKRDLKLSAEAAGKQRKNIILVAISTRLVSIVVRENASNANPDSSSPAEDVQDLIDAPDSLIVMIAVQGDASNVKEGSKSRALGDVLKLRTIVRV